jgi:hypothetical protein
MNCKKCNNPFSVRVWIDGKQKNLQRRKYCLECSPFGQHNTRNLTKGPSPPKICKICGNPFFQKGTCCGACRVTNWRRKKKKFLVEYKGGNCQVCKYDRCIDNLTFHHLDPSKKDFQISGTSKAFETLKAEVDKCVLLCKNCHGEVHAGLLQI